MEKKNILGAFPTFFADFGVLGRFYGAELTKTICLSARRRLVSRRSGFLRPLEPAGPGKTPFGHPTS
eukprot:5826049-Amphidinium_carterae.1